jgi:hypothetical protein
MSDQYQRKRALCRIRSERRGNWLHREVSLVVPCCNIRIFANFSPILMGSIGEISWKCFEPY